jgi:oxaloacetate decarboxylase alpha subunit
MSEIGFVDTTLRDGQASLWAMGMKTGMMLPVAEKMDQAGFQAIEMIGVAFVKKCVRDLREDPWERIRLARQRIKRTPLRAIRGRYLGGSQITPQSVDDLCTERLAAHGIRQIRISDSSNTAAWWSRHVHTSRNAGLAPIINLIYTISPRHSDEYYARKARDAAGLAPERICIKDPGGLLTPERTRTLVPAVLANANGIPVELHTHCNTGLGPLCCLEAIAHGIRSVNTAIPPLANASSNPSVFNVAKNARSLGYGPALDEEPLKAVERHLTAIARREGLPIGSPVQYDCNHHLHQVPGGMISNFRYQLSKVGLEGRLEQVLEETARVRAEFGYPIMVTPYSQFVGVQAAMNVISGERYKVISDEVVQYALGLWGEEESSSMDPDIRDRILASPRAADLANWQPPQPSLKEVRRQYGGPGVSDDDLLLRYFTSEEEVAAMRAAAPSGVVVDGGEPMMRLLERLARQSACHYVQVQKGAQTLTLERRRNAS